MEGGGEKGKRRVKLFCPSVSKVVDIIAGEEQKLNLGSIARAFGLDPNTVKLNGYFISRGADLVASSVTWKSLIGYFSARGLSTGAADSGALVVDGKLSKIGSKRSHDLDDAGNGILSTKEEGYSRDNKRAQRSDSADFNKSNGLCLKRKSQLEDESCIKRTRSDEADSGPAHRKVGATTNSHFSCSIISKNLKRMRVDEMVAAPKPKRIR